MNQTIHRETHPYRGELIRRQSDYDDYACSHGEVSMSGGDGTGPSTRVPVITSCNARY
jgi:hypothetical protein